MSADAIVGKTVYDLYPRKLADALYASDRNVLATGKPVEIEEVVPHDDGLHTYITIKCPLFNPEGGVYAVCGFSTDITARKRTEEELQKHREHLEELVAARTAEAQQRATQLQALALELTRTEERERRRLAEILHEQLQQLLVAVKVHVSMMRRRASGETFRELVAETDDLLDQCLVEARSVTLA